MSQNIPLDQRYKYFVDQTIKEHVDWYFLDNAATHYVFELIGDNNSYILKVRGNHYSRATHTSISPTDIEYEVKALKLFYNLNQHMYPQVIAYNHSLSAIIMTRLNKGQSLLDIFMHREPSVHLMLDNLAHSIGEQHHLLRNIKQNIRSTTESDFYNQMLFFLIESLDYHQLQPTVRELHNQNKQIVFGDLSPKNIKINGSEIYLFDFDRAHLGNTILDFGFLCAHIILHTAKFTELYLFAFIKSYYKSNVSRTLSEDTALLYKTILSCILYRIDNKWVSYDYVLISQKQKNILVKTVLELIDQKPDFNLLETRCKI